MARPDAWVLIETTSRPRVPARGPMPNARAAWLVGPAVLLLAACQTGLSAAANWTVQTITPNPAPISHVPVVFTVNLTSLPELPSSARYAVPMVTGTNFSARLGWPSWGPINPDPVNPDPAGSPATRWGLRPPGCSCNCVPCCQNCSTNCNCPNTCNASTAGLFPPIAVVLCSTCPSVCQAAISAAQLTTTFSVVTLNMSGPVLTTFMLRMGVAVPPASTTYTAKCLMAGSDSINNSCLISFVGRAGCEWAMQRFCGEAKAANGSLGCEHCVRRNYDDLLASTCSDKSLDQYCNVTRRWHT